MLCCATIAAWAGTGDGSKEKPYTGEWKTSELIPKLNEGDHLAYNCVIGDNNASISVYDDKLNTTIITKWESWAVGAPISKPFDVYKDYSALNSPEEMQKQTFIVTETFIGENSKFYIIGHYSGAYTGNVWVNKMKSQIIQNPIWANLGDYLYAPTDEMVYIHQFEYCVGEVGDPRNIILKEESVSLPVDRKKTTEIHEHCIYTFKPKSTVPLEDRPEYQYTFSSYMTDAYADTIFTRDETSDMQKMLSLSYGASSESIRQAPAPTFLSRGGEYIVETRNNAGSGHKTKLTLTCDPDCNVEHVGGTRMGEQYEIKVTIASGYPYNVKDYQGKKMHLSVFDADNKAIINNKEFVINASADSTKMEFVKPYSQKFGVNSTKFTIKLSGDLLKEEKVVTFDAQPNYVALEEAIQIAESICNEILNKHALYVYNVNILKNAIEKAKNGLNLFAYQQNEINQYCKDLVDVITSVQEDMKKKFVEVNDAKGLKDAIDKDPGAKIHLTSDIDMSLFADSLQGVISFHGVINGIKDPNAPEGPMYTITGGSENTMPLFNGLVNAAFVNIAFNNFVISNEDYVHLGVISNFAKHSVFKNIKMESITISGIKSASTSRNFTVGTIAGDVSQGCIFDNIDVSNSYISGGDWVGGVVGKSETCMFQNCHINSDVLIYSIGYSGGISAGATWNSVFEDCENQAVVGARGAYAGGIVGSAYRRIVTSRGVVQDGMRMMGYAYPAADFFNCINKGKIIPGNKEACEKCFQGKEFTPNTTAYTGGICGESDGFKGDDANRYVGVGHENIIDQCSNYGEIYGKGGGILGRSGNMIINNCLNACNSLTLGGIIYIGYIGVVNSNSLTDNHKPSKITNCLSLADCPLIGVSENTNPESNNNYSYISDDPKHTPADYEMGVTEETIKSGVLARWLNNGISNRNEGIEPWRQNLELQGDETEVDSHPVLDSSHRVVTSELLTNYKYRITSADQLVNFAIHVRSGHQFTNAYLDADINIKDALNPWVPIGKDEDGQRFRGIFDGRGHTISGLTYTSEDNVPLGLFAAVDANAEIRNVIVGKGSRFVCKQNRWEFNDPTDEGVGGIVGKVNIKSNQGTVIIENCGSYADIEAGKYGGGILGKVDTSNGKVYVNNCFNMGNIKARAGNSALLCGYTQNNAVVSNCWSGGRLWAEYEDTEPCPYDWNNPKNQGECFVGYENQLDIKNCYVVSPAKNIDHWGTPVQDGVTIHENYDDLANGKFARILNGNTNDATKSLTWQQNLGTDGNPVCGNKGVYHARKDCNEYGTICLPYYLKSDENIRYYQITDFSYTNGEVQLKFAFADKRFPLTGTIPSGAPVLFRVKNTGENSFYDCDGSAWGDEPQNPETLGTWELLGTFTNTVFEDPEAKSIYYVANNAVKNAKKTTVAPYRAYFRGPNIEELGGVGNAKIRIVIDDEDGETTALELIGDELVPVSNGKTYSLMGTEVGNDYRGIVIKNGKKVFQK